MPIVAGADGCRAGWFRVALATETGALTASVAPDAAGLLALAPIPDVLVVDMPIGLTEAGPRDCDRLARRRLGRRGSSVFPAPLRAALAAESWEEAHALTQAANRSAGLPPTGLSKQSFHLIAKIRDLDRRLPQPLIRVVEGHPELAFLLWNADGPLLPKRTPGGRAERERLVEAGYPGLRSRLAAARAAHRGVGPDDALDAVACLRVAERVLADAALSLPGDPPRDARGLPMAIHG